MDPTVRSWLLSIPIVAPVLRVGASCIRVGTQAVRRRVHDEWVAPLVVQIGALEREIGRLVERLEEAEAERQSLVGRQQEFEEIRFGATAPRPGAETPAPPETLRWRVVGTRDLEAYLRAGRQSVEDISQALRSVGRELSEFSSVLDFGCGCGRTICWLPRTMRLHGSDIDAEAIGWCRVNLPWAEFDVNEELPPLAYEAETFDLVYALSVFTHLDEDHQFRWLAELNRVTKPGGLVLVSIRGKRFLDEMPPERRAEVERTGLEFVESDFWTGVFPDWYQTTNHTEEYVRSRYRGYFELLGYLPLGLAGQQDFVVLRRDATGGAELPSSTAATEADLGFGGRSQEPRLAP